MVAVAVILTTLSISSEVWQRIPARDKERIKKAIVEKNVAFAKRIVAKYRKKKGNPNGNIPRFKVIHCKHKAHGKKGKVIARFDRKKFKGFHVPQDEILAKIRRHYKREHPKAFKRMTKKAQRTKRAKS